MQRLHKCRVTFWRIMRFSLIEVFALLGVSFCTVHADDMKSLNSGGRDRTYFVHLPPSYDGRNKVPLILVLHGGGGNAEGAANLTDMNPRADSHGFVVVYPDGTGKNKKRFHAWNIGGCCGYASEENVD